MSILRHVLAAVLGLFLIAFGAMKFVGAHIFQFIEANATDKGLPFADLFHPLLNTATGVAELIAGVLVLIPATRFFGALLGTGVVAGAIAFHVSPYLGVNTPGGFAETSDGAPWTLADFPPAAEYSPVLFGLALVMFAVALTNLVLARRG